jgi:hypothetical protein
MRSDSTARTRPGSRCREGSLSEFLARLFPVRFAYFSALFIDDFRKLSTGEHARGRAPIFHAAHLLFVEAAFAIREAAGQAFQRQFRHVRQGGFLRFPN